jgi:hypothetical protein
VHLRLEQGGEVREERVAVNQLAEDAPYLYEDPAAAACAVELRAWREDEVRVSLRESNRPPAEEVLKPGESLALSAIAAQLNLQQVMAAAVAVPGGQVNAMYLRIGDRPVTLREGLLETVGDYRLRYDREPVPPDARYQIAVVDAAGKQQELMSLRSGNAARVGAWVFALADENPFAPAGVAIAAERRPGGVVSYIGLSLFILGSFGLVLVRFRNAGGPE